MFVDVEGIHERSDKRVWFKAGTMGSLLIALAAGDGASPMVSARSLQYKSDGLGAGGGGLISVVLPASRSYSGAQSSVFKRTLQKLTHGSACCAAQLKKEEGKQEP